jgi:hypothetical protein
MTDPAVLLEDEYLTAARTLQANKATRARIDAEDDAAKEILRKLLAEGETGIDPGTGEILVKVRVGARVFDEATATRQLPDDLRASVTVTETVTRIDKQRAKDLLAPALYDLCCKASKPAVVPA